jgi:hypothetical protein
MAKISWIKDPVTVIQDYNARHGSNSLGPLVLWATFVVEGLYYLDDLDADWDNNPIPTGSHNPDIVDIAHVHWATGNAITALDLCAATLGRRYCNWTNSNELDLRDFDTNTRKRATKLRSTLPQLALHWVNGVLADSRYTKVLEARKSLTHSRLIRHLQISAGVDTHERTDFNITGLARIGARDLVLLSRDLAGQQVDSFLQVIDAL